MLSGSKRQILEKEKYRQKNFYVRIVHKSCVCVDYICVLLCVAVHVIVSVCVCVMIHALCNIFEVVS